MDDPQHPQLWRGCKADDRSVCLSLCLSVSLCVSLSLNLSTMTVWGQSAGAMSVAVHLVSPASHGLFQRAIMESNVAAFHYQTAEHQQVTLCVAVCS